MGNASNIKEEKNEENIWEDNTKKDKNNKSNIKPELTEKKSTDYNANEKITFNNVPVPVPVVKKEKIKCYYTIKTKKDNKSFNNIPNKLNKLKNNLLYYLFDFLPIVKTFEIVNILANKRLVLLAKEKHM